jgi:hypothetical protein
VCRVKKMSVPSFRFLRFSFCFFQYVDNHNQSCWLVLELLNQLRKLRSNAFVQYWSGVQRLCSQNLRQVVVARSARQLEKPKSLRMKYYWTVTDRVAMTTAGNAKGEPAIRGLIKKYPGQNFLEKWQPCRILGNISWRHIPEEQVAASLIREWVDQQCKRVCPSVVLWKGCVEGATCSHQVLPETW